MKNLFEIFGILLICFATSACNKKIEGEIPVSLQFLEGTWRIDAEREVQAIRDLGNELSPKNVEQISSGWVRFSEGLMTLGGLDPKDEASTKMERIEEAGDYVRFFVEHPSTKKKEGITIVAMDKDTIRVLLDHQKGKAQQFLRNK